MDKSDYQSLLAKNIQSCYKKTTSRHEAKVNKEAKQLTEQINLEDRVEAIAKRDAFLTIKDTKPNFRNNTKCRIINPSKPELGKVSKKKLEVTVKEVVKKTGVNLWKSTGEVIQWFKGIQNKESASFIVFDIQEFYPSISEKLLNDALDFANKHHKISALDRKIIIHKKRTLLLENGQPWIKSENYGQFDVAMGSYDGAETCEAVVCYLLSKLAKKLGKQVSVGCYRDDGLAICYGTPREIENHKKEICKIFQENGLKITIEANKKVIDYLDITLDLTRNTYSPYMKPGNRPTYINIHSNHPPSVQ